MEKLRGVQEKFYIMPEGRGKGKKAP